MRRCHNIIAALALIVSMGLAGAASAAVSLFFLHHSTGRNLINGGGVRSVVAAHNASRGTKFRFWDHDYIYIGLRNPDGVLLGYHYGAAANNTDPDGLYALWTTNNAARDSILANHDVIAFKSCFPASGIPSAAALDQYKTWYVAIRDVFDQHPDKVFVVMSPPPLHRLATDLDEADRARAFANWLASPAYLAGHPNVVCFNLFDHLAQPNDGSATRNMLRWEYEGSHTVGDSHPNSLANQTVGPLFAAALMEFGDLFVADEASTWGGVKAQFR
jgi:hypothetical protein